MEAAESDRRRLKGTNRRFVTGSRVLPQLKLIHSKRVDFCFKSNFFQPVWTRSEMNVPSSGAVNTAATKKAGICSIYDCVTSQSCNITPDYSDFSFFYHIFFLFCLISLLIFFSFNFRSLLARVGLVLIRFLEITRVWAILASRRANAISRFLS